MHNGHLLICQTVVVTVWQYIAQLYVTACDAAFLKLSLWTLMISFLPLPTPVSLHVTNSYCDFNAIVTMQLSILVQDNTMEPGPFSSSCFLPCYQDLLWTHSGCTFLTLFYFISLYLYFIIFCCGNHRSIV